MPDGQGSGRRADREGEEPAPRHPRRGGRRDGKSRGGGEVPRDGDAGFPLENRFPGDLGKRKGLAVPTSANPFLAWLRGICTVLFVLLIQPACVSVPVIIGIDASFFQSVLRSCRMPDRFSCPAAGKTDRTDDAHWT